jgi:hypothetical protein
VAHLSRPSGAPPPPRPSVSFGRGRPSFRVRGDHPACSAARDTAALEAQATSIAKTIGAEVAEAFHQYWESRGRRKLRERLERQQRQVTESDWGFGYHKEQNVYCSDLPGDNGGHHHHSDGGHFHHSGGHDGHSGYDGGGDCGGDGGGDGDGGGGGSGGD